MALGARTFCGTGDVATLLADVCLTGFTATFEAAVEGLVRAFLSFGVRARRMMDSSFLFPPTIFCITSLNPELFLRVSLYSLNSGGGRFCDIKLHRLSSALCELLLRRCRTGVCWMLPSRSGTVTLCAVVGGALFSEGVFDAALNSWMRVAPLDRADVRSVRSVEMTRWRGRFVTSLSRSSMSWYLVA